MPDNKMQKYGTALAIGVLVVAVLFSVMLPTAINAFNNDQRDVITQSQGNITELGVVDSTVTAVTEGTSATVELNDTSNSNAPVSETINVSENATFALADGDWVVTVESTPDANTAKLTYEYPKTYGWNNGSGQLFNLLPVFLILGAILTVVGYVNKQT